MCEFANEAKYFGVMVNSSFKITNGVKRQTRNFYAGDRNCTLQKTY